MKKLTLDLDTIAVQSFSTARDAAPVLGTVRGNEELRPSYLAPSQCYTSCTREQQA
ncbi:MAG TPA: hypothetical protein VF665_16615 [Longimicrobium sp.]|jgi:hypothetical protein|uniref:hypothetical protein n=1 Tax=Longimicrobium sp. TaxID=2029185 RepID=UPI002ED88738